MPRHGELLLGLIAAVTVTACGGKSPPTAVTPTLLSDMAAPQQVTPFPQGSLGDLGRTPSPIYDLAWSACVGTPLQGTCVERYFEPFIACFRPAGHCYRSIGNATTICWEDGATLTKPTSVPGQLIGFTYAMDHTTCLERYGDTYCRPGECTVSADGGVVNGGASYVTATGIFTCPDGTQVNIGSDFGGCTVLQELLSLYAVGICDGQGNSDPACYY